MLLQKVKETEEAEEDCSEDEEEDSPPWWHSSKEGEKGAQEDDGLSYTDGRLRKEFWADKWNLFRECKVCQNWTYVNASHPLRQSGCRGCMHQGCTAGKPGRKLNLLRSLKALHGEKVYLDYLVDG